MNTRTIWPALILSLALPAGAQEIWRCGPDGRSYSSTPCAEGRRIEATAPRPAGDVAAAREHAAGQIALAERERRSRLLQEKAMLGNGMTAIGPVAAEARRQPVAATASEPKRRQLKARRSADAETWRATAPASRRMKG